VKINTHLSKTIIYFFRTIHLNKVFINNLKFCAKSFLYNICWLENIKSLKLKRISIACIKLRLWFFDCMSFKVFSVRYIWLCLTAPPDYHVSAYLVYNTRNMPNIITKKLIHFQLDRFQNQSERKVILIRIRTILLIIRKLFSIFLIA